MTPVERVEIRPLAGDDAGWLTRLRLENREFLEPFDPPRPPSFLTEVGQRDAILRNRAAPDVAAFAILADETPVGTITISNIIRGALLSGAVGYWVARPWNGRGIATRAVERTVAHAFTALRLRRLEAGTLVDNVASQRVLLRNGFRWEGYARRYLQIAHAREDHLLFGRIAEEAPPARLPAPVVVREARPGDAGELHRLRAAVADEPAAAWDPPAGGEREERRRIVRFRESGDGAVLVAEAGGGVVGRLDVVRDAHPLAGHVAELGLAVSAPWRRRGVGTALVDAARSWAAGAGIASLEAHVSPLNTSALRLLDNLGFRVEGFRAARFRRAAGPVDALLLAGSTGR